MVTLQTVVDDDVAQAVKEAAARDRRSVSEWIALRLEEVLDLPAARLRDDPDELARREAKLRPSSGGSRTEPSVGAERDLDIALGGDPDCAHSRVERRSTTFGVRRFCADCDRFMS